MLTAKAANFDGRYLPVVVQLTVPPPICLAAFIDVVYPLNAWAAVATRAKSSRSLVTIYLLNPAVSNNELLIGDTIGRAPANLRANTIDEAKTLFCKATGTALDFAACSLSSNIGFWRIADVPGRSAEGLESCALRTFRGIRGTGNEIPRVTAIDVWPAVDPILLSQNQLESANS